MEKTELELLKSIEGKVDSKLELSLKEAAEAKSDAKKYADEIKAELKKINESDAAKGATLEQMQGEFTEFKAKQGKIAAGTIEKAESAQQLISKALEENFDKIKGINKNSGVQFQIKSQGTNMTSAANLTGSVQISYASQPALRPQRKLQFRDLVSIVPSATGLWQFYRQTTTDGSFDFQTTHGNAKQQLDYNLSAVQVTADYLAGFVRIAKQMVQDLPFMQSFVTTELIEDYLRQESGSFFGTVQSSATAGSTSASVTVEKVIDYITQLYALDYDPNGIVTTPAVWGTILKTKPNDYSIPGGVSITATGDVAICGIPLYKSNNITAAHVLVGDWTKAAIIQAEGLNVNMFEQDSDNVQKNLVTVRAEARVGLAVLRTDAFVYGAS